MRHSALRFNRRLVVERLESRALLTVSDWNVATGNANWNTPESWDPQEVPNGNMAEVVFPADKNATINLDTSRTIKNLGIEDGSQATLDLSGKNLTLNDNLNVFSNHANFKNSSTTTASTFGVVNINVGAENLGDGKLILVGSTKTMTLSASGQINLGNDAAGKIVVGTNATVKADTILIGAGTKDVNEFPEVLLMDSTSTLQANKTYLGAANVTISAYLTMQGGSQAKTGTTVVYANSEIVESDASQLQASSLTVTSAGIVKLSGGSSIAVDDGNANNTDNVTVDDGGFLQANNGTIKADSIDNSGALMAFIDENNPNTDPKGVITLSPRGNGTVDYTQNFSASLWLRVEAGGASNDSLVNTKGNITLGGGLSIQQFGMPGAFKDGNTYPLITAQNGQIMGNFNSIDFNKLYPDGSAPIINNQLPALNDATLAWKLTRDGNVVNLRVEKLKELGVNDQGFDLYGHTAQFVVNLNEASDVPITFAYWTTSGGGDMNSAIPGVDYQDVSGTLTFNPGVTTVYVDIPIIASRASFQDPVQFSLSIYSDDPVTVTNSTAIGTIYDEQFSIQQTETVTEGPNASVTLWVTPSNPSSEVPVSVSYADQADTATRGADYTATAGTLTWQPGDSTPQSITIPITDDSIPEPEERFFVNLNTPVFVAMGLPVNAFIDPVYRYSTVTINDDDPDPTVYITSTTSVNGGATAELHVTLSKASGKAVTVQVSTRDGDATAGTDYQPISGSTVTFNPGDTDETVDISTIYNPLAEYDEDFYADLAQASNSTLGSQSTATITINGHPNQPPTAVDDVASTYRGGTATGSVLGNDTDPENDPLTAVLGSQPANGTLTFDASGSFSYTASPGFVGIDSFSYQAKDSQGNLSNSASVTITVRNRAPTVTDGGAISVVHGKSADISLLGNASDADNDPLTIAIVSGPSHGSLVRNSEGAYTYTAYASYSGPDSFTFKANDGIIDSDAGTVPITVTNYAPVASGNGGSTPTGQTLIVSTVGVTDQDNDALTTSVVSGPLHGSVSLNNDGSFSYTPSAGYAGPDSFTYKANDGVTDSNVATVSITVGTLTDGEDITSKLVSGYNILSKWLDGYSITSKLLDGYNVTAQKVDGFNVTSMLIDGYNVTSEWKSGYYALDDEDEEIPGSFVATDTPPDYPSVADSAWVDGDYGWFDDAEFDPNTQRGTEAPGWQIGNYGFVAAADFDINTQSGTPAQGWQQGSFGFVVAQIFNQATQQGTATQAWVSGTYDWVLAQLYDANTQQGIDSPAWVSGDYGWIDATSFDPSSQQGTPNPLWIAGNYGWVPTADFDSSTERGTFDQIWV